MAKEKNDKIKNFYIVISTIGILLLAGWKTYCHFAKTTTVEAITKSMQYVEERLAIGTHDQRVMRQEQEVTRAKNRLRFEKKHGIPTRDEEEEVVIQEKELEKVVEQRQELIEEYKSKK